MILEDEQIIQEFSEAYEEGHRTSREPLFKIYSEFRRAAEVTEEEAFENVVSGMIPRGLQRPPRIGSKYPEGPGR